MPDSPSGASITRSSPKSFCRPSVIRKTPPSLPTSRPITSTLGSASIRLRRAGVSAAAMLMVLMPILRSGPCQRSSVTCLFEGVQVVGVAGPLLGQLVGLLGIDVVERRQRTGILQRSAGLADALGQRLGLGVEGVEEVLADAGLAH